jgi:hypothetical protein
MMVVRNRDDEPLAELCRSTPTETAQRIGMRLGIPVFTVAYTGNPLTAATVMRVGASEVQALLADQLAEFINTLHDCESCHQHRSGRFAASSADTSRQRHAPCHK